MHIPKEHALIAVGVGLVASLVAPLAWAAPETSDRVGVAVERLFSLDQERLERARQAREQNDVTRYDVDVCVDPERRWLSAECRITMHNRDGNVTFALNEGLVVLSVSDSEGRGIGYTRDAGVLSIGFGDAPLDAPVGVAVCYEGTLTGSDSVWLTDDLAVLGSESNWYPISAETDAAQFRVTVRCREGLLSVCSGALSGMARLRAGAAACAEGDVWEARSPIGRVGVVVGRLTSSWAVWGGVSLGYYEVLVESAAGSDAAGSLIASAAQLKEPVRFLETCYGRYPYEWLNVVSIPPDAAPNGAVAVDPGLVVMPGPGTSRVSGAPSPGSHVSALSRSWWPFAVDSGELVAEGLATYARMSWLEATGRDAEAEGLRESARLEYVAALVDSGGPVPPSHCLGTRRAWDRRVCGAKGLVLFETLDRLLGRETFCEALRTFGETHAGGVAGLRELASVFEDASGEDLDWLLYEWIHRGDLPTYTLDYDTHAKEDGGYVVKGSIHQDGEPYLTPLPVTIDLGGWTYDECVSVSSADQTFAFETDTEAIGVVVDARRLVPKLALSERALLHYEWGRKAGAANEWGLASDAYGAASRLEPESAVYRFAYGEALVRVGRFADAFDVLEEAVRLDPYDAEHRSWLADVYLGSGDNAAALRHLDAYADLAPNDPAGHGDRALALIGLGRLDEASRSLGTALALAGNGGPALTEKLHIVEGRYHEAVGDTAAAIRAYEQALEVNPISDVARKWLTALTTRENR